MSPTLLELIIAVVLLWAAWQIGVQIAPLVLAYLVSFWRGPQPPPSPEREHPMKTVIPPSSSSENSHKSHGNSSK